MKNTKLLMLVLLIACIVAGILTFWDILTTFLVSAVMAYLLCPIVSYVTSRAHVKRGVAVAVVFCFFAFILSFIISVTAPSVIHQMSDLLSEMQRYAFNLDSLAKSITEYMDAAHLPKEVIGLVTSLLSESDTYILSFMGSILTSIVGFSLQVFDLIVVIILMIYFMLDGPMLIASMINILPASSHEKMRSLLKKADLLTWRYVKSRCVVSGWMALATFIGLRLMGIKYALLFALISFVLDFIPYFGSFIAGVIEAFYALITGSVSLALAVTVFVIIVQQIEGNIISPKVQGDAAGIHPITVMFALLACNQIWGTLGMLISVPVAAVVKLAAGEVYAYIISPDGPSDSPEKGGPNG